MNWPPEIIKNLQTGDRKVVAWIGAGLMEPLGYPNWKDLVQYLIDTCERSRFLQDQKSVASIDLAKQHLSNNQLFRAADICETLLNIDYESKFHIVIKKKFNIIEKEEAKGPLRELLQIPFTHFITTNYNLTLSMLTNEIKHKSIHFDAPIDIIPNNIDPTKLHTNRTIIYAHGNLKSDRVVLSENSYRETYKEKSQIYEILKQIISGYDIVFLGTRADDSELRRILDTMDRIFKKSSTRRYLLECVDTEPVVDLSELPADDLRDNYKIQRILYIKDPNDTLFKGHRELYEGIKKLKKETSHIGYKKTLHIQAASGSIPIKINEFYESVSILDYWKDLRYISDSQSMQVFKIIKEEPYRGYFFQNLKSPSWFNFLRENNYFKNPPAPIKKGTSIEYPFWGPGKYIVEIAGHEYLAEDIIKIIKSTQTENYPVYHQFAQALLKLPSKMSIKVINLIPKWLKIDLRMESFLIPELSNLMICWAKDNYLESAFKLLDILVDIEDADSTTKLDTWHYEKIIKENVPELAKRDPIKTFNILQQKLVKAIKLENRSRNKSKNDQSYLWRPAIEDNPQNWEHENVKNLLIKSLRDIAENEISKNNRQLKSLVKNLWGQQFSIFRRLALHLMIKHYNQFKKFIHLNCVSKSLWDDVYLHHEYYRLLHNHFKDFNKSDKSKIFDWIDQGPDISEYKSYFKRRFKKVADNKEIQEYRDNWTFEKLQPINNHIEKEWKKRFDELSYKYKDEREHPDFLVSHYSGGIHPKAVEGDDFINKTIEEKLKFVSELKPKTRIFDDKLMDYGYTLEKDISEYPSEYEKHAKKLWQFNPHPTIIYYYLRGFEQALKNNKYFDWAPIFSISQDIISYVGNMKGTSEYKNKESEYREVRQQIANLLNSGFHDYKNSFKKDDMRSVWVILKELLYDPNPGIQYEKKYGGKNMDPLTLSLNTVRGMAMHTLIQYALFIAKETMPASSTNKKPFPPGNRMTKEVQLILEDKLDKRKEKCYSIHIIYGRYFFNLYYLNKKWTKENVNKIFPLKSSKKQYFLSAWDGYLASGKVFNEIYKLLKPQYKWAIANIRKNYNRNQYATKFDEILAEHLMIMYWRNIEQLKGKGYLLPKFYENASGETRRHAVWFLSRTFEEISDEKRDEKLRRYKSFWQFRIISAQSKKNKSDAKKEIKDFAHWLEHMPFEFEDIFNLLDDTVDYFDDYFSIHFLLKYLDRDNQRFYPLESIRLIKKALKNIPDPWFTISHLNELKNILERTIKSDIKEAQQISSDIINWFGSKGIHDFRDLLQYTNNEKMVNEE